MIRLNITISISSNSVCNIYTFWLIWNVSTSTFDLELIIGYGVFLIGVLYWCSRNEAVCSKKRISFRDVVETTIWSVLLSPTNERKWKTGLIWNGIRRIGCQIPRRIFIVPNNFIFWTTIVRCDRICSQQTAHWMAIELVANYEIIVSQSNIKILYVIFAVIWGVNWFWGTLPS